VERRAEQFFLYQNANGSISIAVPAQGKGLAVTGTFGPPPSLSTQDYGMMQVTDAYNYWLFSGDTGWVARNWAAIRGIMTWLASQVGTNGLMSGVGPPTTQMSTNAHYYGALQQAQRMATAVGDTASASTYASLAPAFGKNINSLLFNRAASMYSASTSQPAVFDEIGNGYALLYGLPALDPTAAGRPHLGPRPGAHPPRPRGHRLGHASGGGLHPDRRRATWHPRLRRRAVDRGPGHGRRRPHRTRGGPRLHGAWRDISTSAR
jgi:hypothetical protein